MRNDPDLSRENRIRIAEAAMGARQAKGHHFLPGARNRIIFAIQSRRFSSVASFAKYLSKLITHEEQEDWAKLAAIVGADMGIDPSRVIFP